LSYLLALALFLFGSLFDLRDHPLTRSDWRKLLRPGAFREMFSIDVGGTPKTSRSLAAEYPLANFVSI